MAAVTSSRDEPRQRRKRVSFAPDEDCRLRELVMKFGDSNWRRIAAKMGKRDRRQCRERWFNYLTPSISNGPWTTEEEELLRVKVSEIGRRWKLIQPFFPGRTDINIKNHWKRIEKAYSAPSAAHFGDPSDPFDQLMLSVMKKGTDPSGDAFGDDGFGFGFFW
jgi:hypothetical protein